ncbi:wax synthase family protein [Pseudochryseolinea flava]|uniref:Wax synthase domain-containing protein n=1 Tax=Pseudochryseolinea flava TaxID=2059302 RepID=A0A364XTM5_9BACT|nr:membrane bound O-acyl transferase family-domain-containing protein [Pseudochryseolinea flava]RAV97713.1 hypothetical protein DQQ10_27120 [Pseudochryseolinea flava]
MDLTWLTISFYACLLTIIGYYLPNMQDKSHARAIAWVIAVSTVLFSTAVTWHYGALARMLVIVFLQLLSMKIIVSVESYSGNNKLTITQWCAFSLGWFGMRPTLFEKFPSRSLPFVDLFIKGLSRIAIGYILLYASFFLEQKLRIAFFLPQLLLLVGVSFMLHFGVLNISTAGWRNLGVDVSELFRSPYKPRSLKEFWGRRWNLAFSEMTALIAYKPLKDKVGVTYAVTISFLFSGLLHEIAISLPVNAGYGLPMIYFIIHAVAMQLESKSAIVQKIVNHRIFAHAWVMTILIIPMPLLFHTAFMERVMIPLRDIMLGPLI